MYPKVTFLINKITFFLEKLIPWPLYFVSSHKLPSKLSSENLSRNVNLPAITVPIQDQHAANIQHFRFGKYNASASGCASIALFNALLLKNCCQPLPVLIHHLECSGCLSLGGKLGTNPYRLNRVLQNYSVKSVRYRKLSELESALVPCDTAILIIWNDRSNLWKGAHFFTVQRQTNEYIAFNRLAAITDQNTLRSIIGNGNFITGYRIF